MKKIKSICFGMLVVFQFAGLGLCESGLQQEVREQTPVQKSYDTSPHKIVTHKISAEQGQGKGQRIGQVIILDSITTKFKGPLTLLFILGIALAFISKNYLLLTQRLRLARAPPRKKQI